MIVACGTLGSLDERGLHISRLLRISETAVVQLQQQVTTQTVQSDRPLFSPEICSPKISAHQGEMRLNYRARRQRCKEKMLAFGIGSVSSETASARLARRSRTRRAHDERRRREEKEIWRATHKVLPEAVREHGDGAADRPRVQGESRGTGTTSRLGIAICPEDAEGLANVVCTLAADPDHARSMGERGALRGRPPRSSPARLPLRSAPRTHCSCAAPIFASRMGRRLPNRSGGAT